MSVCVLADKIAFKYQWLKSVVISVLHQLNLSKMLVSCLHWNKRRNN